MDVSIIIPVGKEDESLYDLIYELQNDLSKSFSKFKLAYEIVVVSDVFDINTLRTLMQLSNLGICRVFFLSHRIGKGGSIKNVVRFTSGDYIVLLDADIPVSAKVISYAVLFAKSLGLDILVSERIHRNLDFSRRLLSIAYNCIINILFRTGIKDHQSGFKILSRRAAKILLLGFSRSDDLAYDTELIVWSKKLGLKLGTLRVVWREKRNKSTIRLARAIVLMLLDIILLRIFTIGKKHIAISWRGVGKVYSLNEVRPIHVEFTTILRCSWMKRWISDIIRKAHVWIVSRC